MGSSEIHQRSRQLYTISDMIDYQPPPYTRIIDGGILNVHNRMLIFGDEGSWKSMLAMHIGHSISRGSNLLGFKTNPCNVFRLQAELPLYIDRERTIKYCAGSKEIFLAHSNGSNPEMIEALAKQYSYPPRVINRTETYIHIDESSGWESLRKDVETCISLMPTAPLVVILDPLFKMFNRNINNEEDVRPMLDKIDILMDEAKGGLSFIIVHHTRKAQSDGQGSTLNLGSQDATGNRVLVRWCDTILRIDPDPRDKTKTKVNAEFTKTRNAEDIVPLMTLRWSKDTLHPTVHRTIPVNEDEEVDRGEFSLLQQE